jgi:HD-like signal output (HDOD) protein
VLPFILVSRRNDSASVREVLPLAPTAYLTTPLNRENLTQRLQGLLLSSEDTSNAAPIPGPGLTLATFLERRRDMAEGAPLMTDVQVAIKRSLNPGGLDLKLLEEELRTDPQITAVLIAAANSAAQHQGGGPVQTVAQALHQLGTGQSMNLILGLTLKRCARLNVPWLADYAERYWELSLHTAEYARMMARMLDLEQERCYCAGLLHRLGDLALLRCMEEWKQAGGELDEPEEIGDSLEQFGAGFGSALRTRWRLPLELRELIAAVYGLGGGVYSREALVMNMAAQMAHLPAHEGLEELARGRTARLLKIGLPELMRLRRQ